MPAPSRALLRNSKAVRWAVGIGAAAMLAIAIVLLFLLTLATNNRELYERNAFMPNLERILLAVDGGASVRRG